MSCQSPPLDVLDDGKVAALKDKYRKERDKRLRPEHTEQYIRPKGVFAEVYEVDPNRPVAERDGVCEEIEVVILGGGWSGLLAGYYLRQAGVDFRHIEHGGDFGGVWYWNRYPGVQCDNESYCYLPLLEETGFMPSKRFADGDEIQGYCRLIAEKYAFYDKALFHTRVTGLRWDDALCRWRIATDRGDEIRARHVVMANGLMNMPKLPGIPGIADFQGKTFHSSRWDYAYTGGEYGAPDLHLLADKTVAIIGTGATAIQAVPHLARHAKHLFVAQRTPSTVDERPNPPTDAAWAKTLTAGWQQQRQANFHRGAQEAFLPGEIDLVCDLWTEISRNLEANLAAEGRPALSPQDLAARREAIDFQVMERLRGRVDALIDDPETAEALKPWFRFPCKRPLSSDDYYPSFNRPNVSLIDVSQSQGVERITERGFVANGREYAVDCMIFASGFEVSSELDRRWGIPVIEGREGLSLYEHWRDGPRSLHGLMTTKFPNLYYTGYIQGGLNSSTTEQFNQQTRHIAHIIGECVKRGVAAAEPSPEAEDAYVRHFGEVEVDTSSLIAECTPSYYSNEGDARPKWLLMRGYGLGWNAFMAMLSDWRKNDRLEGLNLR